MDTVRFGLIGAGGISNQHCRAISKIEGAEIVAAADINEANLKRAQERWGIPDLYPDYNRMLERDDIDAVLVCTPTAIHGAPTVAALRAGKHVLCEKPMEASLERAIEMTQAAHESGKNLMVALKLRFTPHVKKAKEIVDAGTLGEIYYAEAIADRRRGNPGGSFIRKATAGLGACADIGVYALDTALYLMGHPKPIAVSGITSNYLSRHCTWNPALRETEVEDFACGWVLFENGARMVFKTCWCMHMDSLGGTIFLGTKAGLRIGIGEVRGPQEGVYVYGDKDGEIHDQAYRDFEPVDVFLAEDAAFVHAVRNGLPSPIPPDEVLLTQIIIQGVVDSQARGGREVEVHVPTFT
ncbi:MAG: Gfo/Idh/MocA family oxidoreductase [Candidatus Poribacteria bacterium]|nr:MAG: Gfo/Idh/MocA family oxidoreductase [Candidatus Poribacteria bacterium]